MYEAARLRSTGEPGRARVAGAPRRALVGSAGNQRFAGAFARVFDVASDFLSHSLLLPLAARRAMIFIPSCHVQV